MHWRSYVPDAELVVALRTASAFAFLSDYEGFGLTPLEALAAGIPIVVLDTPIAREIYGPAALLSRSGRSPALIARALERVLVDDGERERACIDAGHGTGRALFVARVRAAHAPGAPAPRR